MKRKGISPLIAAVLLIAFTMAVASIFAEWAPGLVEDAQGDTSNTSQELQSCVSVTLDIKEDLTNATSIQVQQDPGTDRAAGALSATFLYGDIGAVQVSDEDSGVDFRVSEANGLADVTLSNSDVSGLQGVSGTSDLSMANLSSIEVTPLNCQGSSTAVYEP